MEGDPSRCDVLPPCLLACFYEAINSYLLTGDSVNANPNAALYYFLDPIGVNKLQKSQV